MKKQLLLLWLIFYGSFTYASIGEDLQRFFESNGALNNVTKAGAYKDQTAGYYTGGSFVSRNQIKNAQIATLQMPGFRGGCGGIDAWAGGFSHIRSEELVRMLRNVGSNAASYGFMLAIQTVSPQVYNLLNELNALATKINNLNINTCEVAATGLGGLWPKSDQSSKHLCQAMGSELGAFTDWAAARQGCGAGGNRDQVFRERGGDPRYKDMLVGEFNLAWKAIQSNAFLNADRNLAQLFMTLVGSIISRKNGDSLEIITLSGHADREDVLNGLLNGGETPLYVCDSDKCLRPILQRGAIPEHQGLLRKVHITLESLVKNIYDDVEPTPAEKDFLNATRLPVYKMLNVITAYRKGSAPLDVHQYGELIAIDVLYKYILEVIDILHDSVTQLKAVQVDDSHIERFLKSLRLARERITLRRNNAFQHMDSVLSFIEATQVIEKQLHVMLGSIANQDNS